MIYDKYPNKEKCDALGGIIIDQRDGIRVTRREHLCIFIKHKDFGDHEFYELEDIEEKEGGRRFQPNLIPVRIIFMQLL